MRYSTDVHRHCVEPWPEERRRRWGRSPQAVQKCERHFTHYTLVTINEPGPSQLHHILAYLGQKLIVLHPIPNVSALRLCFASRVFVHV